MTPATAGMGRTDANRTDAGRTDAGRTDAGPIGALRRMGIVPVVVIDDAGQAAPLAEALLEAGIADAEVTLRTPAALGGPGLAGLRAIVTGGDSGIGLTTAPLLPTHGTSLARPRSEPGGGAPTE